MVTEDENQQKQDKVDEADSNEKESGNIVGVEAPQEDDSKSNSNIAASLTDPGETEFVAVELVHSFLFCILNFHV